MRTAQTSSSESITLRPSTPTSLSQPLLPTTNKNDQKTGWKPHGRNEEYSEHGHPTLEDHFQRAQKRIDEATGGKNAVSVYHHFMLCSGFRKGEASGERDIPSFIK